MEVSPSTPLIGYEWDRCPAESGSSCSQAGSKIHNGCEETQAFSQRVVVQQHECGHIQDRTLSSCFIKVSSFFPTLLRKLLWKYWNCWDTAELKKRGQFITAQSRFRQRSIWKQNMKLWWRLCVHQTRWTTIYKENWFHEETEIKQVSEEKKLTQSVCLAHVCFVRLISNILFVSFHA